MHSEKSSIFADKTKKQDKMQQHPLEIFKHCPRCGSKDFGINDFKSKRCADCDFVLYFNAIAAVVAIITNKKGEILVARRAKEPAKGTLDLPGGFIDSFETAEEGVAREVAEETGLKVCNTRYLFSQPNKYIYSGFEEHTLDLFFLCETEEGCVTPDDDVEELQWVAIDSLRSEEFGLQSIRRGIEILKARHNEYFTKQL